MAGLASNFPPAEIRGQGQETDRLSSEFVISCFPPGPLIPQKTEMEIVP